MGPGTSCPGLVPQSAMKPQVLLDTDIDHVSREVMDPVNNITMIRGLHIFQSPTLRRGRLPTVGHQP
jgi:hypothetical protein